MLFDAPPSLTVTVMVAVPKAFGAGVKLNDPPGVGELYVTAGFGIMLVSLEMAVTVRVWLSFGAPEVMPVKLTT